MSKPKLRLPRDLRGHVRRAVIKKITPCVLLLIAFGAVLYLFGERIFELVPPAVRIGAYVLAMLLPFVITRVPFCLFDRTFVGKVKQVHVQNEYVAVKGLAGSNLHISRTLATFVYLSLDLPDGKEKRIKTVQSGFIEEFKPGDTVFHLYGTNHTIVLPEMAGDHVECPVCGDDNRATLTECHSCGHTLIKSMHDLCE
jgi:ribosomal protein S27E